MFMHNKRLMYTVRVSEPNPGLATLMLEQFGGPQGELAAAMRYFTQAVSEDDPGRKDMLFDIRHLAGIDRIATMPGFVFPGDTASASRTPPPLTPKPQLTLNANGQPQGLRLVTGNTN